MDLPEIIERNVHEFMKPIRDAGYTKLVYEKSMGSIETQLKSYLLFAFQEQSSERDIMIWYGGGLEASDFCLSLKTKIHNDPIEFGFKGKFDPKYEMPALFHGLQVSKGSYSAYYPNHPNNALPTPDDAYEKSIQTVPIKVNKGIRVIKSWIGKVKRL
ncbi:hypothetical protein [Longitalea luteola]|uniref:hypothetical protein n=1 Tax=Longitalea luteola TaxID=2812563 RepID=UPI001A964EAC|nr:hypothetical protein [Longitalea luteola]